jgi:25S rRNA (adenine2142-N1)-methyltransferase
LVSSKATRTIIRSHHTLEKQKAQALADGNQAKVAALTAEIEAQGGIQRYQKASLLGQSNDRGGDSSKILMDWLRPFQSDLKEGAAAGKPLRMLEVGALSMMNACSRSQYFEIERIDLNSQAEGIKQQDFMERPLPTNMSERFDIISLSLVLNYVPDPAVRGQMLMRTTDFLKRDGLSGRIAESCPCLFLVLPAPCVLNSRYMDEPRLDAIMTNLGFSLLEKKVSRKLVYYLWRLVGIPEARLAFKKEELRSGKARNNFAVVLKL